MTSDDELRTEFIGVERPVPLEADADQRVRARMLHALSEAASDDVIELDSYAPAEPATRGRRRPLVLAAAAVIVVAGVIGIVALDDDRDRDPDFVTAATPEATATPDPGAVEPRASVVGHLPFSTVNYVADPSANRESALGIVDRAGEAIVATDGSTNLEVRRRISGATVPDQDDLLFTITTTPDGRTLLPFEAVAPVLTDGTVAGCLGGSVEVGPAAPDQKVIVVCEGEEVVVDIVVTVGPAEDLPLLDAPVAAVPVTFEVTRDGGALARSTHWYDDNGLVRQDIDYDGSTYEAAMNAGDLTRRNLELGLTEESD